MALVTVPWERIHRRTLSWTDSGLWKMINLIYVSRMGLHYVTSIETVNIVIEV